ncbi:hypothetical protein BY458DRAFT_501316 [Sporodiniella umbellata]|nr:hypothetical protein BY458DRAFT_501316 [Sporodiniella umbellata]
MEQHLLSGNVHGWLMNVPNYHRQQKVSTDSQETKQAKRPTSVASVASDDSVNLDELISVNFTTSMEEELDLSDLSLLDLDDSKESFWKVETVYIPSHANFNKKPSYYTQPKNSNDSFQKKNTKALDKPCPTLYEYDTLSHSSSFGLPMLSPKSSALFHNRRSGSMSSEVSMNSQSSVSQHRSIWPTKSTSTSSFGSQSTAASARSRSTLPIANPINHRSSKPLSSSISENTVQPSPSISHFSRRATHIPTPSTTYKPNTRLSVLPQSTKSSSPHRPNNLKSKKASHIPTPPPLQRSATSMGLAAKRTSGMFESKTNPQFRKHSLQ